MSRAVPPPVPLRSTDQEGVVRCSPPARARTAPPVLLLLAMVLGLLLAAPATAAYPSTNGPMVFERRYAIWLVQHDGSGLTNLTHTPDYQEGEPVQSPDGTRVAFSLTDIYDEIWTIDVDGNGLTEVNNPIVQDVLGSAETPRGRPTARRSPSPASTADRASWPLWVADVLKRR